jgi:hypothetical protein
MTAPINRVGFRPLLPAGIHQSDWAGLNRLCVDYFPTSTTRPRLMSTVAMLARLITESSIPSRLWVGGDFLTERQNPHDCIVSLVLVESVHGSLSNNQREFFDWFRNTSLYDQYRCETYGMVLDAGRREWEILQAYWLNQYGLGGTKINTGIVEILMPTLINL